MEPGRELDRLVAEAMGIPIYPYNEVPDDAGYLHLTSGEGGYLILRLGRGLSDLWAPSSDSSQAMWAWEWLESNKPWIRVSLQRDEDDKPTVYHHIFGDSRVRVATGETYPHAICLAVLAAKEAGNVQG